MQSLLLVDGLWSGIKVHLELVAQVNVYFPKSAFPFAEGFEMLINVLPLGVPGIGFFLEPCEEVAFLLLSVEKVIAFVHDALIASASQCLGFDLRSKSLTLGNAQTSLTLLLLNRDFLRHALVVVTLALVLGLGKDVDAK